MITNKLFNMPQKKFQIEIKDPKYNQIDIMHYYTRVEPRLYHKMKLLNDKNRYYHQKFKEQVHNLVRIRNSILNLQIDYKENDKPEEVGLLPTNIAKFIEYTKKLEQDKVKKIELFQNILNFSTK